MFGREVIEGEQWAPVLLQAFGGLLVLDPSGAGRRCKDVRECEAEYAANKAAIRASRQTKRDFVASCRAGTETIPTANTAARPPATYNAPPAPPNSPAPTTYAPAPAPSPVPASTYQQGSVTSGAGEFTSEQQARYRCPSDTVVWVNTKSRIYHFAGTHNYGTTAHGAYMCEADAKAAGDRAALNETHP